MKNNKTIECFVIYFDLARGEGMVRSIKDGSTAMLYACNIPGKKTWFAETACVYFGVGQIINVIQDANGFIIGVTPGEFDAEKWNGLDHDRLAFKCAPDGTLKNGLFA